MTFLKGTFHMIYPLFYGSFNRLHTHLLLLSKRLKVSRILDQLVEISKEKEMTEASQRSDVQRIQTVKCPGFNQAANLSLMFCNFIPPSKNRFYFYHNEVSDVIHSLCSRSMEKYRENIYSDTALSFDGAWARPRNSHQGFAVLIDINQNKVVDFHFCSHSYHRKTGNFDGYSQSMERGCFRQFAYRWS